MNYALGYAFNLKHMFMKFSYKKVTTHYTKLRKIFGDEHKNRIAETVFKECVKLVIKDVIENNTVFKLPVGSRESYIKVKRICDNDFVKARKRGKFMNIDFLKSFWTGHQLILTMKTKGYEREKCIYIDKNYKNRLEELTNQGKQYG